MTLKQKLLYKARSFFPAGLHSWKNIMQIKHTTPI